MKLEDFEPYQQRVILEKKELDEKIAKLDRYLWSDDYPSDAGTSLLQDQLNTMEVYSRVLTARIGHFVLQGLKYEN